MALKLFDTLTQKEKEVPKKDFLGIYSCGPTVYNRAHIGNLRSYIFADTLNRALKYLGYKNITHVINITDVGHLTSDADTGEDKVEKEARKEGKTAQEVTEYYTRLFKKDLSDLNIEESNYKFPKATENIQEQIDLIKKLEEKNLTYKTSDGIYFDTSLFPEYGKLGNINVEQLKEGSRVEKNPEKKNPTDFALWKFSKNPGERQQEWNSPWGLGFPGWHIECSAMSMKYLGESFDIHTGGIDHIPVHHNNEIAQSQAATGKPLAQIWAHNAFINLSGGKMAKSQGTGITLEALGEEGIHPLSYRYWILTANYQTPMEFSWKALEGAQNALEGLVHKINELDEENENQNVEEFKNAISKNLNTPIAISILQKSNSGKEIFEFDQVLGLNLEKLSKEILNVPQGILKKAEKRWEFKKENKFEEADRVREEIESGGFIIHDYSENYLVERTLKSLIKQNSA